MSSAPSVVRVVHTPIIEHPYDSHRRRERDRLITLQSVTPHHAPPKKTSFTDDNFGLKVCDDDDDDVDDDDLNLATFHHVICH